MYFYYAILIIFLFTGGVYVPPPYNSEVIQLLATLLVDNPRVPLLVLGDFNAVI